MKVIIDEGDFKHSERFIYVDHGMEGKFNKNDFMLAPCFLFAAIVHCRCRRCGRRSVPPRQRRLLTDAGRCGDAGGTDAGVDGVVRRHFEERPAAQPVARFGGRRYAPVRRCRSVGFYLLIDLLKKKKHDHNQILLVPKQKRKAPFFVLHSCLLYRSISPSFFCFHLQIFITFFLGGGVVRNTANLSSFLFVVFRSVWSFYSAHYLWRWHLLHIWNVFVEFFFTSLLPTIWFVRRVCVDGRANAVARDRTFIDHRTKAKIKKNTVADLANKRQEFLFECRETGAKWPIDAPDWLEIGQFNLEKGLIRGKKIDPDWLVKDRCSTRGCSYFISGKRIVVEVKYDRSRLLIG